MIINYYEVLFRLASVLNYYKLTTLTFFSSLNYGAVNSLLQFILYIIVSIYYTVIILNI